MDGQVIWCCSAHKELNLLDETGADDERLLKLLKRCAEGGDEYSKFLLATRSEAGETDPSFFVADLHALADAKNPWALSFLGRHYRFTVQCNDLGAKYLSLGALFGDPIAQFYFGYDLLTSEARSALGHRLIRSSAASGYERAKEELRAMQNRSQKL